MKLTLRHAEIPTVFFSFLYMSSHFNLCVFGERIFNNFFPWIRLHLVGETADSIDNFTCNN